MEIRNPVEFRISEKQSIKVDCPPCTRWRVPKSFISWREVKKSK
jgi:hypothetical protein